MILVRGYLGRFMPGNFVAACRSLVAAGLDARVVSNAPSGRDSWVMPEGTLADNVARLERAVDRIEDKRPLVFAGHSKGGLEALLLLLRRPDLASRTRLLLLSQTPRGPSRVLESVLLGLHQDSLRARRRLAEVTQRVGLGLLRAGRAGRELTRDHLPSVLAWVDARLGALPFPIVQTASWSTRPTTWLDSFHERLGEVAPEVAHDGQFLLAELLWPAPVQHVLLPRLDHAQPVMDGFGFDSARYWQTLLGLHLA